MRNFYLCLLSATLLAVTACGGGGGGGSNNPPPANAAIGSVDILSGNGQSAAAGTELPAALVARVRDASGNALANRVVNFHVVTGGGSVFAGAATSDATGDVRERWTLGTGLGAQTVEIRGVNAAGAAVVFATFTATSVAGASATLEKDPATENQAAVQTQQLPSPLAVFVSDTFGNPKAGVTVNWAQCADCGSVTLATSVTNQNGEAQTGWTLGTRLGTQTVTATVASIAPVTFAAESLRAPPTAPVALVAISGGGQSINQHAVLPLPAVVQVTDVLGNGVPGVTVDFASGGTSGYITPSAVNTNADGFASYAPYIHHAGAQQLAASVAGLTTVNFDVTVAANTFRYDGFYQCATALNGPSPLPGTFVMVIAQDVITGAWGEGNRRPMVAVTFDTATGAYTGQVQPSLDTTYRLAGSLTVDADEIAGAQGTLAVWENIHATGATGAWSCTRY